MRSVCRSLMMAALLVLPLLLSACNGCGGGGPAPSDGGTDAGVVPRDAGHPFESCAGRVHGDPAAPPPDWELIACEAPASSPCAEVGGRERRYSVCSYVGDAGSSCAGGGCPCGEDGKACVMRAVLDRVPCVLPPRTEPLSTGPWGDCLALSADEPCATSGVQQRGVLVCGGGVPVPSVETRTCARVTEGLELQVGEWSECGYPAVCAQEGTGTRSRSVCQGGLKVALTETRICTRSTDGLVVGERTLGPCEPVSLTDCSPQGLRQVSFQACRRGELEDAGARESCDLPLAQVGGADGGFTLSASNLAELRSFVEVSRAGTVSLTPEAAYDGVRKGFEYTVAPRAVWPISPGSVRVAVQVADAGTDGGTMLTDFAVLTDADAESVLRSATGDSTGSIQYAAGKLHIDFAQAPPDGGITGMSYQAPYDLTIDTTYLPATEGSTLELCRLRRVHGNLTLKIADGTSTVRLPALTEVLGTLTIRQNKSSLMPVIQLPVLARVRGDVVLESLHVDNLALPSLARTDGSLRVHGNQGASLRMSQLTRVGGALEVGITKVDGSMKDVHNPKLVSFELGNLDFVGGDFLVGYNPELVAWVTNLSRVGGDFRVVKQPKSGVCKIYDEHVRVAMARQGIDGGISVESRRDKRSPDGDLPSDTLITVTGFDDADNDGFIRPCDNCPVHFNPDQVDSDNDGLGDECDSTPRGS